MKNFVILYLSFHAFDRFVCKAGLIYQCLPPFLVWSDYNQGQNCSKLHLFFLISVFSAVYLILYIESELQDRGNLNRIIKVVIELVIGMLGFACALTRIYDFKHYVSDVLIGSLIGTIAAWKASSWTRS